MRRTIRPVPAARESGLQWAVRWLAVTVALAVVAWSPAGARAANISTAPGSLTILDFAGEVNTLTIAGKPGVLVITDTSSALQHGRACTDTAPNTVECPSGGVVDLSVLLGGEDDRATIDDTAYVSAPGLVPFVNGAQGRDTITTGAGADAIADGPGDDTIASGAGPDTIVLSEGADTVDAGDGNDRIDDGSGDDVLSGGAGDDRVFAGPGDDRVDGGPGDDTLSGEEGADRLAGGDGNDRLDLEAQPLTSGAPSAGADELAGGAGDDRLSGGAPADTEPDALAGGPGSDVADYSARGTALVISLDDQPNDGAPGENDRVGTDVERVVAGRDSDSLIGSEGDDALDGGPGDDLVLGGGGRDTLEGGPGDSGNDSLSGGEGEDVLRGGPGDDSLEGGAADDSLFGGGGSDTLAGGGGQDTLFGGPGLDTLRGGDGNDTLNGSDAVLIGADGADDLDGEAGDDLLLGGPGTDRLDGGPGADAMRGEAGRDTVSYETRTVRIVVAFDGIANDGEPGEGDDVGADVEIVLGGTLADTLTGDGAANTLDGGSGEDLLIGAGGRDVLSGGSGVDLVRARDGSPDVVICGPGKDLAIVDPVDSVRDCENVDRLARRRPKLGAYAVLERARGTLTIRPPEASRFFPLPGALRIPIESAVDARAGTARIVAARDSQGGRQAGEFWGGIFTVRQRRRRRPVTEVRLTGGSFRRCRAPLGSGKGARAADDVPVRSAWGRVGKRKGRFRTRGRHSATTVRGTIWLTQDRCDGTLTRVVRGTVKVRDFGLHRTVVVHAGESYLARARGR